MPVVVDTIVGYQVALELVLSVIAVLVALVAVVAVVAVLALPVNAPTNVVEFTETNPAMVVTVAPKETVVEPIVMLELFKALLGIEVKLAPLPLNKVEINVPVLGIYCNLVELVSKAEVEPLVTAANNG